MAAGCDGIGLKGAPVDPLFRCPAPRVVIRLTGDFRGLCVMSRGR
jgi:hypothetical protein